MSAQLTLLRVKVLRRSDVPDEFKHDPRGVWIEIRIERDDGTELVFDEYLRPGDSWDAKPNAESKFKFRAP